MIDFKLKDGSWIYVNPTQIIAICKDGGDGTLLYANGNILHLQHSLDTVKTKLREIAKMIIP